MKKSYSALLALFLLLAFTSTAQTLVNKEWQHNSGTPSFNYKYFTSTKNDTNSNIFYLVGNTYTNSQQQVFVGKVDDTGNPLWVQVQNASTSTKSFGVDITQRGAKVWVTGTNVDSSTGVSQIVTMQLEDSSGSINWVENYGSSSYNVPAKIIASSSGDAYICGSGSGTPDQGMVVLKYNNAGSLQWTARYDESAKLDGATALALDSTETTLTVTGFSGTNFSTYNFVTLRIDAATGAILDTAINSNGNGGFSRPVGIAKGNASSITIAGTAINPTNAKSRIKLISYDAQMNENWVTQWGDSTLNTEAVAMQNDMNGGVITLGTRTNANGRKEMVLLRHNNNNGSLDWAKTLSAPNGEDAEAGALEVDLGATTDIFITGSTGTTGNHRMTTASYTSDGNLKWVKDWKRSSTSDDLGGSIELDEYGYPMVTAFSHDVDSNRYVTVKYATWDKPNDYIADTSGAPQYMNHQLIVKFRRDMVNKDFTDNNEMQFTNMKDALNGWAYDTLNQRYSTLFNENTRVEKIYKGLKSTYTTSIARNGDHVPMPDFWASYLVYIPTVASRGTMEVKDILNTMFPYIEYANANYCAKLNNVPANCPTNDGELFRQKGLYDEYNGDPCGINIDSAWCLETGKPFVKVGIYDTGLDGTHSDLGGNASSFSTTKVKGFDFYNYNPLDQVLADADGFSYHGTGIAGVIGAIRNDGFGISGIAGGNFAPPNDNASGMGVTLYGMKVGEYINKDTFFFAPISVMVNAYVVGSSDMPDSAYGYALHISNHSYGYGSLNQDSTGSYLSPTDFLALEQATHYANRNQMAFFVSAGNSLTNINYPTNFNGDWITCVTASNSIGGPHKKWSTGSDPSWDSFIGAAVDIAAPGEKDMTYSLNRGGGYGFSYYYAPYDATTFFYETSFATPYVTGVAALLKSYIDTSVADKRNLSPEDLEQILTKNAVDIDSVGKDFVSGSGRLNANAAMQYVNKTCRKVKHFTLSGVGSNTNVTEDSLLANTINPFNGTDYDYIPIKLSGQYKMPNDSIVAARTYQALVFKIKYYCTIPVASNCKIVDAWIRNSSSVIFSMYDTTTGILQPYEKGKTTFIPPNKMLFEGYSYEFIDTNTNTVIGALGGDLDSTRQFQFGARFDFTVIMEDTTSTCATHPTIYAKIEKLAENIGYSLYPNPTMNSSKLEIYTSKDEKGELVLTDLSGRELSRENILVKGTFEKNINLDGYAEGIYVLKISVGKSNKTIKITKL